MKYSFAFLVSIALSYSSQACSCNGEKSFCDLINEEYFLDKNPMICIAESTGNTSDSIARGVEMKVINLLHGEIQKGSGDYLNSDSTFWILSGASSCDRDAFFFKNAGEQFVVATTYGEVFIPVPPPHEIPIGYKLELCQKDNIKFENTMNGTIFESWRLGDTIQHDIIFKSQVPAIVEACLNNERFNLNVPTITCPENTFLGPFGCLDIDDVPPQVGSLEEVMTPPYNIQIEGDIPYNLRATFVDDDVIFFCEGDPRLVTRDIIIYLDTFEPWFTPPNEIGRCTFTIETKADVGSIEFTAPPNKVIDCDEFSMVQPADEIMVTGDNCIEFKQSQATFSDEIKIEGNNSTIVRTWQITDVCGNLSEPKEQIFTNNCEPTNQLPNTGMFNCDN